jgi:myo-inositol 2-dehydrogenase / D-chiro-inositol 1-dehydrogenase
LTSRATSGLASSPAFYFTVNSEYILAFGLRSCSKEVHMTIRFGLLGAGRIGKVHARAVGANPQAKLVAVVDALETVARDLAGIYGADVRTIGAIETATDIDAVIICTPTDTHADLIERFARAGKAVFCEKPIDLDIKRVEQCLAVVDQHNVSLMVGFNRRFDPHFAAVRKAIDDGAIGQVEMVSITSRDPGPPPHNYITRSGGIFRDMTIHDFDMARFLLGEEPVAVSAHASVLVDKTIGTLGDFDSVSIILETASGRQCLISNSRRATYGYDQRIEVHGSKGMVAAENLRPVAIEIANASGYTRPPLHDFFMTRYLDAYANEITAFIEAITAGKTPSPSGQDGLIALRLAEAALQSAKQGRTVRLGAAG